MSIRYYLLTEQHRKHLIFLNFVVCKHKRTASILILLSFMFEALNLIYAYAYLIRDIDKMMVLVNLNNLISKNLLNI